MTSPRPDRYWPSSDDALRPFDDVYVPRWAQVVALLSVAALIAFVLWRDGL